VWCHGLQLVSAQVLAADTLKHVSERCVGFAFYCKKTREAFFFQWPIPCISDQCVRLVYQPGAQWYVHVNSRETAATCLGNHTRTPSSESTDGKC
jgi:hypothetical protein